MDSSKPTCYLSFPDNAPSAAAAEELRVGLEERGIIVLPPGGGDDVLRSTIRPPFHWLRQSDAVVLDMTGDSSWVAYEAGAAQALDKFVIPIAQQEDSSSSIRWQLPRILYYELGKIDTLANYVRDAVMRTLPAK